jgi:lytic murein transglycosylase
MHHGIAPISIAVLALIAGCASQPRAVSSTGADEAAQSATTGAGLANQEARRQELQELDQKSCPAKAKSYDEWVMRFQSFALNQGRPEEIVETAFLGVKENAEIAERASKQPEFVTPIWTYLDRAVSPERIERGKEMYALNRETVTAVAEKYGVSDAILMGIWGIETDFGRNFGDTNVFEALTNLGYGAGRSEFACAELMAAIDIVAEDDLPPGKLVGSWAGAMGHPQFLPSSYLKLAVDEDGSGAPDLWSSMPDAFASSANHLKRGGWRASLPWGFEVSLPEGFPTNRRNWTSACHLALAWSRGHENRGRGTS